MPFVYNYLDSMVMAVMKNKRKIFRQQKNSYHKGRSLLQNIFQLTHPRGVRLNSTTQRDRNHNFNSRTREGVRQRRKLFESYRDNFNSRTREGCDRIYSELASGFEISTHAPARGATVPLRQCEPGQYFNSRTRVGCDQFSFDKPTTFEIFQLTHPRGVRPRAANLSLAKYIISTHAPAWGATILI